MTRSRRGGPLGAQEPRVSNFPPFASSSGAEAIDLAESAGVFLEPWQQHVIEVMLGEREDGNWSSYEFGFLVSRQNGKGEILLVRELAGLFLLGERLILHSAHHFPTSKEAFIRLRDTISRTPHLMARVQQFYQSNQETAVVLKNGARVRFMTRTKDAARGFSAQTLLLDEAQEMTEGARAALLFTTAAQANPQIVYTGTAPSEETVNSEVFTSVRDRGRAGGDPQLGWMEWSVDPDSDFDPADPLVWAQTTPTLGRRISVETLGREQVTHAPRKFAEERLSYWPNDLDDEPRWLVVTEAQYQACDPKLDPKATGWLRAPLALAVELTKDRQTITAVMAGDTDDGPGAQVVVRGPNTPETLDLIATVALDPERPVGAVVVNGGGMAGGLIHELEPRGVTVTECPGKEQARATGATLDLMRSGRLKLRPHESLDLAVAHAETRKYGDAELIDYSAGPDPTPLVGVILARWGVGNPDAPVALAAVYA